MVRHFMLARLRVGSSAIAPDTDIQGDASMEETQPEVQSPPRQQEEAADDATSPAVEEACVQVSAQRYVTQQIESYLAQQIAQKQQQLFEERSKLEMEIARLAEEALVAKRPRSPTPPPTPPTEPSTPEPPPAADDEDDTTFGQKDAVVQCSRPWSWHGLEFPLHSSMAAKTETVASPAATSASSRPTSRKPSPSRPYVHPRSPPKAHDGVTGADTQKTAEKAVQADLPWLTHELRRPPVTRADSAAAAWAAVRIYENEVMLDPVLLRTWTTPRVPAVMQL